MQAPAPHAAVSCRQRTAAAAAPPLGACVLTRRTAAAATAPCSRTPAVMHAIESRAITRTSPAHATCGPARASAAACLDSLTPHTNVTTEAPRHVKSVLSACRPRAPLTFRACTRWHRTISYYTDSMKVSLLLLAIGAGAASPVNVAARRFFPNKAAPSVSVPVKHRRKLDECASTLYMFCYKEDDCEVRRERSFSSRSLAEMSPGPAVPSGLSHLANAAKCQHLPAPACMQGESTSLSGEADSCTELVLGESSQAMDSCVEYGDVVDDYTHQKLTCDGALRCRAMPRAAACAALAHIAALREGRGARAVAASSPSSSRRARRDTFPRARPAQTETTCTPTTDWGPAKARRRPPGSGCRTSARKARPSHSKRASRTLAVSAIASYTINKRGHAHAGCLANRSPPCIAHSHNRRDAKPMRRGP